MVRIHLDLQFMKTGTSMGLENSKTNKINLLSDIKMYWSLWRKEKNPEAKKFYYKFIQELTGKAGLRKRKNKRK